MTTPTPKAVSLDSILSKLVVVAALGLVGVNTSEQGSGTGEVASAIKDLGARMEMQSTATSREMTEAIKILVVAVEKISQLDKRVDRHDTEIQMLRTGKSHQGKK